MRCTEVLPRTEANPDKPPYALRLLNEIHFDAMKEPAPTRQEKINKLLSQLPSVRPSFQDIPEELWWRVFIDAPYHEKALEQSIPGRFFDNDKSPGFQRSMTEFFRTLTPGNIHKWDNMDFEKYTHLHETVIKYIPDSTRNIPDSAQKAEISEPWTSSLREQGDTIGVMMWGTFKLADDNPNKQEQLDAIKEMENDIIKGIPLFTTITLDRPYINDIDSIHNRLFKLMEKRQVPEAMSLGIIIKPTNRIMNFAICHHDLDDGKKHIKNILELYNQKKRTKGRSDYQVLRDIIWVTRAMHMVHYWGDANGRTNITGFFIEELSAAGYCPTILSDGPDIFGNLKTLDKLTEYTVDGMHSLIRLLPEYRSA